MVASHQITDGGLDSDGEHVRDPAQAHPCRGHPGAVRPDPSRARCPGPSLVPARRGNSSREQADRRERIIKLSRDITSTSKKVIFSCHRIASVPLEQVIKDATPQFATLATLFAKLQAEVVGEEFWKYERSCSPGIQEYLEGLTFYHYLIHRTVPSLSEVQATLSNDQGPLVHVTVEDYLGGIADLSGEMMRLAIGSIGKSLSRPEGEDSNMISIESIGLVVRELKGAMDPLAPLVRNFHKKMVVLDQSLTKIESGSSVAPSTSMLTVFSVLRAQNSLSRVCRLACDARSAAGPSRRGSGMRSRVIYRSSLVRRHANAVHCSTEPPIDRGGNHSVSLMLPHAPHGVVPPRRNENPVPALKRDLEHSLAQSLPSLVLLLVF